MIELRIQQEFIKAKNTQSDINEHLDTLYNIAKECSHITEMGVRNVVSTWAFMMRNPETLVGIDIHTNTHIDEAKLIYPKWNFIQADTTKISIEQTDLLFIDTLHTYLQLKKELLFHSESVNKYIILHDTETYGHIDEPTKWQTPEIMANYAVGDKIGLMPAITEFLYDNQQWYVYKIYRHNNGLTILKRKHG